MLDMGFIDDIESIMKNLPSEKQTLLFSATMPRPIVRLAEKYMQKPKLVTVSKEDLTVPLIDQFYYETTDKLDGLCRVFDGEEIGKAIVFCRTKKGVDELVLALANRGYLAEALHGDLSQSQRDRVMKKFREGKTDILIATDVAARGLDIDNITHSINYDIPQDPESYVHRIGRTGRAGNKGTAMTFITPREFRQLKLIEKVIKTRIVRKTLPTAVSVLERQKEQIISRMFTVLEQGKYEDYRPILEELMDEYAAEDVAMASLKLMQEGNKALVVPQEEKRRGASREAGMVRLFMNLGKQQKITPEEVVRTIAGSADIPGNIIGLISIYDKFTFVEIPEDVADKVISSMHRGNIRGYKVNVELARPKE
jgi:ATP-dependent RNA helicase DeaD